jgi:hypothetical protein
MDDSIILQTLCTVFWLDRIEVLVLYNSNNVRKTTAGEHGGPTSLARRGTESVRVS